MIAAPTAAIGKNIRRMNVFMSTIPTLMHHREVFDVESRRLGAKNSPKATAKNIPAKNPSRITGSL
jgi:hypothetical protein